MTDQTPFSKNENEKRNYFLSLPERSVRSLAALIGGTTTLLTDNLLPEPVRETTFFKSSLGMMQEFLIVKVAGMNQGEEFDPRLDDDFAARKMLGSALDFAGLLTVGFSPLWVFAIASDVANGSKVYLERLTAELKESGLIEEEANPTEITEILDAIEDAAKNSAENLDTPPISRESLEQSLQELREKYDNLFRSSTDLMPEIDSIWQRMTDLASSENISLERLSGMMSTDAMEKAGKRGTKTVTTAAQTGGALIDEVFLESYRQTLADVSERGVGEYISDHFLPFWEAAKAQFDQEKETWTESQLSDS